MEIIPAILPKNYEDLKNKIALVRDFVPLVQIDICDGRFVNSRTWPFVPQGFDSHFVNILNEEEGMPFWEDVEFELDLMVSDAVENFDIYTKLGPKRIIFHLEAFDDTEKFKEFLEGIDIHVKDFIDFGVAINTTTEVEKIFPIVSLVEFVQVMGIEHIGFQGEEFDDRCIDHIKALKEKFPDLPVSVDGGVDLSTAYDLKEAGADRLVSGSAIFGTDDIIGTIEAFREI